MRKLILAIPLLIILLLLLAVVMLSLQLWFYGGIVLLVALILNIWSESFPLHYVSTHQKDSDTIRILTYNVNRAYSASKNKGTTQDLVHFIKRQQADVVLLQEYNQQIYPEIGEQLLTLLPYGLDSEEIDNRFKSVFSKFPIMEYEQLRIKSDNIQYELSKHAKYYKLIDEEKGVLPVCSMSIKVGDGILRLINCHLMSNNFSVVMRNVKKNNESILHAILPVMAKVDDGYAARKIQAEIIVRYLSSCKERAFVVCGDFNDISGSSTLHPFRSHGLKNAWWKKGLGFGFTFHGMNMRLRLDHILYSDKTLCLKNVYVPHSVCSDHNPVVCDFIFNKEAL